MADCEPTGIASTPNNTRLYKSLCGECKSVSVLSEENTMKPRVIPRHLLREVNFKIQIKINKMLSTKVSALPNTKFLSNKKGKTKWMTKYTLFTFMPLGMTLPFLFGALGENHQISQIIYQIFGVGFLSGLGNFLCDLQNRHEFEKPTLIEGLYIFIAGLVKFSAFLVFIMIFSRILQ